MSEITLGERFTPRESEVALLAACGLSNKQIGHRLGLSPNTVSNYLKRVYAKASVQSRTALAWQMARAEQATAVQQGLGAIN